MLNIIDTVITNPTDCLAAPYKVLKKRPWRGPNWSGPN